MFSYFEPNLIEKFFWESVFFFFFFQILAKIEMKQKWSKKKSVDCHFELYNIKKICTIMIF